MYWAYIDRHIDMFSSSLSTTIPATADPALKIALQAFLTLLQSHWVGFRIFSRSMLSDTFPSPRICDFVMWQHRHGCRPKLLIVAMMTLSHRPHIKAEPSQITCHSLLWIISSIAEESWKDMLLDSIWECNYDTLYVCLFEVALKDELNDGMG